MSKTAIGIILFVLLVILLFRFQQFYKANPAYHNGQQVSLVITLQQEPDLSYKGQKFSIKTSTNQLISVTANTFPRYHYGEVIQLSGKLKAFTSPDGKSILGRFMDFTAEERSTSSTKETSCSYVFYVLPFSITNTDAVTMRTPPMKVAYVGIS